MKNYKQRDKAWSSVPYAGETMGVAGCGPTSLSDLTEESPVKVAKWLTEHSYAANGAGTYHSGIYSYLISKGFKSQKITSYSLAGETSSVHMDNFRKSIKDGNCGIVLFGGTATKCKDNRWCRTGHYCAVVGYDAKTDQYLVYDPYTASNDGLHPWGHLAGDIKHLFTTSVRWKQTEEEEIPLNKFYDGKAVAETWGYKPQYRKVGVGKLSILAAPDPAAPEIGQLKFGDGVTVFYRLNNGFGHVYTGVNVGYVDCKSLMKP